MPLFSAPSISKNISKLYCITGLYWFYIFIPTFIVFYQSFGISMGDIMIIQGIFSLTMLVLEIPSGYFADKYGRKNALMCGAFFIGLGTLIHIFFQHFTGLLIGRIFVGIGAGFMSGSDSALLYDTLIEMGKEDEYKKYQGRMVAIMGVSEAIASFLGGFLSEIHLTIPYYIYAITSFSIIPVAYFLVEPLKEGKNIVSKKMESISTIVKTTFSHTELKWLIIYSSIIITATFCMAWFIQSYFQAIDISLKWFGILWSFFHIFLAIISYNAYKIEQFFGKRRAFILLLILILLGFAMLSIFQVVWALPFLLLFYFVRGIARPVIEDYVNVLVASHKRATVLSVMNMGKSVLFSIVAPIMGYLQDFYSLSTAFVFAFCIFGILGGISLYRLHHHKII